MSTKPTLHRDPTIVHPRYTVHLADEQIGVVESYTGSTGRSRPLWRYFCLGQTGVESKRKQAVAGLVAAHLSTKQETP